MLDNHRARAESSANINNNVDPSFGGDAPRAAGQDAVVTNLGSPVAHSGPRPGAAHKPTTADRKSEALLSSADCRLCRSGLEEVSRPRVHQAKSGDVAVGGAGFPSLDSFKKHNRTPLEPKVLARKDRCGSLTIRGKAPDGSLIFVRLRCKNWKCEFCANLNARRNKADITRAAVENRLQRMMTLTLDPGKIQGMPVKYLRECWARMRTSLQRKYVRAPGFVAILEFQKKGSPHLHILIDRFIAWEWIREAWIDAGGGSFTDIRYVDAHRVAAYLSKYLTKQMLISVEAPPRSRRITTSRGIHLREKKKPTDVVYRMLRTLIDSLLWVYAPDVVVMKFDREERLISFTTGPPAKLLAA